MFDLGWGSVSNHEHPIEGDERNPGVTNRW